MRSLTSKLILLIGLISASMYANAQIVRCVDSARIDPWWQCNDPRFDPVCGCNLETYRNDCVAFRNFGVNDYSDGVCQQSYFYWDIYPNVTDFSFGFFMQFYNQGNFTLQIRDSYGKLMYQKNYGPLHNLETTIDISGYKQGVYFIMVYSRSAGKYEFKRFIKV